MNTKTMPYRFITLLILSLPILSFAVDEGQEKVIALVTRVDSPQKDTSDTVALSLTIHRPIRFAGLQILMTTDSKDRAKTRADFPVGSLQIMQLPSKSMVELEEQVTPHQAVERMLDSGIDPMKISQTFTVPSVKLTDLTEKPVAFTLSKDEADHAGTTQPATHTESKVEVSAKPLPEVEISDEPWRLPKQSANEGVRLVDWLHNLGSIKKIVVFRSQLRNENLPADTPTVVKDIFGNCRCDNSSKVGRSYTGDGIDGLICYEDGKELDFSISTGCVFVDGNLFSNSGKQTLDGKSSSINRESSKVTTGNTEKTGAGQPATTPESKSETSDKTQPDAEELSR